MVESRHLVSDLLPVYRERRARLERLIDEHHASEAPVRWQGDYLACGRCPSCEEQLAATDDVLLVAGVRVSQRRKLNDAGIFTVADLARDRKSTRLNSSHVAISYAVFCLKRKL